MSDDTVRKIIAQATENARPRVSWECAGCGADYEGERPPSYCHNCVDGYAAIGVVCPPSSVTQFEEHIVWPPSDDAEFSEF
jgi:hypothetical protein